MSENDTRTLYLVATGAPLTSRIHDGVREGAGVVADRLRDRSRQPMARSIRPRCARRPCPQQPPHSDTPKRPTAEAVAIAPATFNTINKLATGIADSHTLSSLCSALGTRTPMVIVPFVNAKLAGHPAWLASLAVLRYAGPSIIDPRDGAINSHEPIESGTGEAVANTFHWSWPFDQLDKIMVSVSES